MSTFEPIGYRCPFCAIAGGAESSCVVAESANATAVMSLGQASTNAGGLLVFPKAHFESILLMPDELLAECMILSKRVAQALMVSLKCEVITLRQNNGPASGQDVWHFHIHVVPRWKDDRWGKERDQNMALEERVALAQTIRRALLS